MNARFRLKEATGTVHDRVDAAFGRYNLADAKAYGCFLSAQAAILVPLEDALTAAGASRLIEQWDDHRRTPSLLADLASLGLPMPTPIAPVPIGDDWELAGALYVLEGSRFGGAVLHRRVGTSFPAAFLLAPQAPGRWTKFAMSLDQLLDTPHKLRSAIIAAAAVFERFELAAGEASAE